jgi:glutamate--cysteine ligase
MCGIDLANAGLSGRAEEDWFGQDERQFLTALRGIAASGRTPADEKLDLYHSRWRGSVDPIFAEFRTKREPGPHASRRRCEERLPVG